MSILSRKNDSSTLISREISERQNSSTDIKSQLNQQLNPHENLIWTGQPKKGLILRSSDAFMIPFSLLWCGFAIFWFVTSIIMGAPIIFSMFGLPFVGVGLYMVFGRFFVDSSQRKHTIYGLTEERLIIKSVVFNKSFKSIDLDSLTDIEYIAKEDGSGSIYFGNKNTTINLGTNMNRYPQTKPNPQLDLIPNVRNVYQQIIDLKHKKQTTHNL